MKDLLLIGLPALGYYLALKVHQYHAFGAHGELANFEYLLWSTLQGRPLALDAAGTSFLSQHVSPILLALAPLYAAVPSPLTLMVLQACAAAAALVPLYLLARYALGRRAAVALTLALALSRVFNYGMMYDFHMEILYPLLFLGAFYAFEKGRPGWGVACVALALAVKEDAAVAGAGLGLYLLFTGRRTAGAAVALLCAAWLAAAFLLVFPWARAGLEQQDYQFAHYWSGYGASLREIASNMLDPVRHAQVLFTERKIAKTLALLGAFAFLPLFSWKAALFLVLPSWFMLYSSDNPQMNGPLVYYGLLILPFLFYATIIALRAAGAGRWRRWVPALAGLVLLIHLGNARVYKHFDPDYWRIEQRYHTANSLIARIPPEVPVSVQVDLQAHVPVRSERLFLPHGLARARYLIFDLEGNAWPLSQESNRELADSLSSDSGWETLARRDGFLLLRRSGIPEGS